MMEPHILVVTSTFPSGPEDTVPRFVLDQVVALKRARPSWRFTVLAPHDARSATVDARRHSAFMEIRFNYLRPRRWQSLAGHGIMPAIRQHPAQLLAVPFLILGEYLAIRRLMKSDPPTLVYAHWFTPQALTGASAAERAGVPFVFTTHASDVAVWQRFGLLGRRIVQSVVRRTARLTAVSKTSLDRMRPFFPGGAWDRVTDRATVIPMGIDLPAAGSVGGVATYEGRRVVLFMGRLAEKKGVAYLLEAFAHTRDALPDLVLLVAGDGHLRPALEQRARDLEIDGAVEFVGYKSGAEKDELYRRADICVLPSVITTDGDAEGLPVSLLEALAYGKLTIATDASNAGEIVKSGVDGLICPAADAAAIESALREITAWPAARANEVAKSARIVAERFEWSSIAEQTAEFLLDPIIQDNGRHDLETGENST